MAQDRSDKLTVKTACGVCHMNCGMEVFVDGGRITGVKGMREHPLNRGALCPKGRAAVEFEYSPERLQYPLYKKGDNWQRISWDEALDIVAERLTRFRDAEGPNSLAIALGMSVLLAGSSTVGLVRRFAHAFGTPNCYSVESLCYRCRMIGYISTLGRFYTADPENAACILVWGHNPEKSALPIAADIWRAKGRGARLVVIDPRRTSMAKRADVHLQPRPGTDTALILGFINVIIEEKLYDQELVDKWGSGFEKLTSHVRAYSPGEVEKITGIPAEKIGEVARLFALNKPGCIVQGTNSLDQTSTGLQSSRGIAILQALTGNIDLPGAFVRTPRLRTNILEPVTSAGTPLGIDKYPLFYGVFGREFGEGQTLALLNAIITGKPYPIKAMIVSGTNPVITWPDSNKVREALGKLDFLVVMDQVMSDTAKMADLVLPAATFFERTEICDYYSLWGVPYVMARKKITTFAEAKPDLEFWLELGRHLGLKEYLPWNTVEEMLDYVLEPTGYNLAYLTTVKPEGLQYEHLEFRKYEKDGFKTPSRKIEFYSQTMADMGVDPMPTFHEPPESPVATPELAAAYPLVLTTGARLLYYTHSRYRHLESLRSRAPEPMAEIHPETAKQYGLSAGDLGVIETQRGKITLRFDLTEDILPGVVNVPHGWAEANVNVLTASSSADPVTGYPALKALLCRVYPAERINRPA